MIASIIFDNVGRRLIGLYIDGSDLRPHLFQMAVIWLTLKISGKLPISKRLLNSLYRGKEIGVAMRAKNFPGIPQYEELDFLTSLQNFPTSILEVFIMFSSENNSLGGKEGHTSL